MSASFEGSGPGSELVRTKRSRSAAGCWPGSTESYRENGASGGERETLRGPVRRSIRAAMFTRQEAAACVRSAGRSSTRASFSASAKVLGETSGPTAGPVPKAEGAPGGSCEGSCASDVAATAAPSRPSDVFARNCLREFGMRPPNCYFNLRRVSRPGPGEKGWNGTREALYLSPEECAGTRKNPLAYRQKQSAARRVRSGRGQTRAGTF